MAMERTYTSLRKNLARVPGAKDVALVPAGELAGLMETAYLLRSPRNARRLSSALQRAELGKGKPQTVDQLRREMKIEAHR